MNLIFGEDRRFGEWLALIMFGAGTIPLFVAASILLVFTIGSW